MSVKEINYILKRVLQMIPVLLLVMVLIFALIRFIPGDPADVMLGARATEESRAMLHAKMGIDKPIYEQFFLFMKNCLRLDFGESILSGEPVSQILARRFQVTASLTGMTALFTMLLALPIGYFSGVNKHNAAGKAINTSALVVMAVPAFWVGILLMYFFGLKLHWFPISGWGDTFGEHVWSLILPAFTQSLGISALQQGPCTHARARVVHPAQRNDLHHHAFFHRHRQHAGRQRHHRNGVLSAGARLTDHVQHPGEGLPRRTGLRYPVCRYHHGGEPAHRYFVFRA